MAAVMKDEDQKVFLFFFNKHIGCLNITQIEKKNKI